MRMDDDELALYADDDLWCPCLIFIHETNTPARSTYRERQREEATLNAC